MSDTITVQETESLPEEAGATESMFFSLMPMILVFAVLYFLVLRPQEKKQREHTELVKSVKKGEKIVLSSGIFGTVIKATETDEHIQVEIADGVLVNVLRSSISEVLSRQENAKIPKNSSGSKDKKKAKPAKKAPAKKAKEA